MLLPLIDACIDDFEADPSFDKFINRLTSTLSMDRQSLIDFDVAIFVLKAFVFMAAE